MTDHIPMRCIELGRGWAVWEALIPPEDMMLGVTEEPPGIEDSATYETVTLYRPVEIEVSDDDVVAYYYGDEGRVYVDPKWVYSRRLSGAKPAYRFGVNGPEDGIDREDVPEEYS